MGACRRMSSVLFLLFVLLSLLLSSPSIAATESGDLPGFSLQWGTPGQGQGQFNGIGDLAAGPSGTLFVADSGNDRIQSFSENGAFLREWGARGSAAGEFKDPNGVAVGGHGQVYVLDEGNSRVQVFTSHGNFMRSWQTFASARGVDVAADGTVYVWRAASAVADGFRGARVRQYTDVGELVSTRNVVCGFCFFVDSLAVGPAGEIFTTEYSAGDTPLLGKYPEGSEPQYFDIESPNGEFIFLFAIDVGPDSQVYTVARGESDSSFITAYTFDGQLLGHIASPSPLRLGLTVSENGQIFAGASSSVLRFGTTGCGPEVGLSLVGNRDDGSVLRPTVHRRAEPGVFEEGVSVGYGELDVEVGSAGGCEYSGPVGVTLTLPKPVVRSGWSALERKPLVPVGPSAESVEAGWSCGAPVGRKVRCTLPAGDLIDGAHPAPRLSLLVDVGWAALPSVQVTAEASFGGLDDVASASMPARATIVGLGDSYSSGEGARNTYTADTASEGGCHRSPASWQNYWARAVLTGSTAQGSPRRYASGFEHLACSGAIMYPRQAIGSDPIPPNLMGEQLPLLAERARSASGVDAVVVTIGGNDALFGPVLARCVGGVAVDCHREPALVREGPDGLTRRVNAMFPWETEVFRRIRLATSPAGSAGHDAAAVYVSGYPNLVPPRTAVPCASFGLGALNDAEMAWLRGKVGDADRMLRRAAQTAGVHYISVVTTFDDNQRCQLDDSEPAMNGIILRAGAQRQEFFHPTAFGYQLWGREALRQAPVPSANPTPTGATPPAPSDDPLPAGAVPDVQVQVDPGGRLLGDNVYNATGTGQTARGSAGAGSTVAFKVTVQNDGFQGDRLNVVAATEPADGFSVSFRYQGRDVTDALMSGSPTTVLAPGEKGHHQGRGDRRSRHGSWHALHGHSDGQHRPRTSHRGPGGLHRERHLSGSDCLRVADADPAARRFTG